MEDVGTTSGGKGSDFGDGHADGPKFGNIVGIYQYTDYHSLNRSSA